MGESLTQRRRVREYWQSYNANLETLKNTGAEALGVTQEQYESLMSYVQSGTEEAAGLAASMASAIESGNTETVATLAETLTEVEQARDAAAQTVSAWTTGFDQSMDEMVQKANDTIGELELSDEAKAAALATMSSYADMRKRAPARPSGAHRRWRAARLS